MVFRIDKLLIWGHLVLSEFQPKCLKGYFVLLNNAKSTRNIEWKTLKLFHFFLSWEPIIIVNVLPFLASAGGHLVSKGTLTLKTSWHLIVGNNYKIPKFTWKCKNMNTYFHISSSWVLPFWISWCQYWLQLNRRSLKQKIYCVKQWLQPTLLDDQVKSGIWLSFPTI